MKAEEFQRHLATVRRDDSKRLRGTAAATPKSPSGEDQQPSVRDLLIKIALRSYLFCDERGDSYAAITGQDQIRPVLRVRGRAFKVWLAGAVYREFGKAASGEAIATALNVAEAEASLKPRHQLDVRFARREGEVWIDLADDRWRAVKITTDGWEVVESADVPLLFRRHLHQAPLPLPDRGGDVRQLLDFLNLADASNEAGLLILAYVVTAPLVDIPRPILNFFGPQGSAKTTAAKLVKSVLDPSVLPSQSIGRDPTELALVLDHHALPLIDNISVLPKWATDLLCRAVSGSGYPKRMLFTDVDEVILTFRRGLLMTGINVSTSAPDLLERMVLVELPRVAHGRYREERELTAEFERARPAIFGGLLDALSAAMRRYPDIHLPRLPRMADFCRWGAAAAEALGYGAPAFIQAYKRNIGSAVEEALESDPVAQALTALAHTTDWTGTVAELLAAISPGDGSRNAEWPKTPAQLGRRLRILQTPLSDSGIGVAFPKKNAKGARRVSVRLMPPVPPEEAGAKANDGNVDTLLPSLLPARLAGVVPVAAEGGEDAGGHGSTGGIFPSLAAPNPSTANQCGACLKWRPSLLVYLDAGSQVHLCDLCRGAS